ncbi:MAG: MBL fold metallo-hydrolase [Chloroflexi bacterium]|nr:MBL fold metallo-hydrolase [Chloroflexota bacterium]
MRRDRVAEDIFVFVSDLYAQVTCTVMLTEEGALVIDSMPYPSEARQVRAFVDGELGPGRTRYVINTHHHADHVYGNGVFEGAEIVGHELCRQTLAQFGQASLARARKQNAALAEVDLRLPDLTFMGEMHLHLGHRHLQLLHTPGHTADGISIFETGERVWVAGDLVMPVPHIVYGNMQEYRASLARVRDAEPDFVVQGHGDVLLRGEVAEVADGHLAYLDAITEKVGNVVAQGQSPKILQEIDIEECGLSRIPLDGAVVRLHMDNLIHLYRQMSGM